MTGIPATQAQLITQFPIGGPLGGLTPQNVQNLIVSSVPPGFKVSTGGQIIGLSWQHFIAKGLNISGWAAVGPSGASNGTDNGTLIPKLFPGINMVRLTNQGSTSDSALAQFSGNNSVASLATFITNMTAQNIVVLVENHDTTQTVYTGATLTAESAWYASWAAAYVNNPYVWFASINEPAGAGATITLQHVATYNAIRGAGNNNPILFCVTGGTTVTGLTSASYATMTNVGWDSHFYNWIPTAGVTPFSSDYSTIVTSLIAQVVNNQTITSADGTMPVIFGEYGPSTNGSTPQDPGGLATVMAVQASGYGCLSWTWLAGTSDKLQSSAALTQYGKEVAAFIAGAPTGAAVAGLSIYGQQTANPINVGTSSTVTLALQGPALPTFTNGAYAELTVNIYNQTNATTFAASFKYFITRGAGSAVINTSAVYGEIGTAGTIAFGSGTINLSWTSIAANGANYTLSIQNTSGANAHSVWVNLTPAILPP